MCVCECMHVCEDGCASVAFVGAVGAPVPVRVCACVCVCTHQRNMRHPLCLASLLLAGVPRGQDGRAGQPVRGSEDTDCPQPKGSAPLAGATPGSPLPPPPGLWRFQVSPVVGWAHTRHGECPWSTHVQPRPSLVSAVGGEGLLAWAGELSPTLCHWPDCSWSEPSSVA